ncbi:MAG: toprim domain-containing protein [Alphaproteobacteria bacterium]|nr:toprim domain-containing protein [Alphaproteobacteria bacterium]
MSARKNDAGSQGRQYVLTEPIKDAVLGHETDILEALGVPWQKGRPHVRCPYPDHTDEHPSWRWNSQKRQACCTCAPAHSIFDVLMKIEGCDFDNAKMRAAKILGRDDLILDAAASRSRQFFDAKSLMCPPADTRDDSLPAQYLAHRLQIDVSGVSLPKTPVVGWSSLAYYDPPPSGKEGPVLVGSWPCAVFRTVRGERVRHAHRIYLASDGSGKAELGTRPDGVQRNPKKSAKASGKENTAGCAVVWGNPGQAPHIILCEGIETGAAIALAYKEQIEAKTTAVAAAISAAGVEAFRPWPATKHVTVAADRDEDKPPNSAGFKRGEQAAHRFAEKHGGAVAVKIALPGNAGTKADWLDVLLREGTKGVVAGIGRAQPYKPVPRADAQDSQFEGLSNAKAVVIDLAERAKTDKGAPFEPDAIEALSTIRVHDPAGFQRLRDDLKKAGVSLRDLSSEVRRYSFRVIQGGGTGGVEEIERAGPYKIVNGAICHGRDTKDGPVTVPLCNFDARIVGEEVRDDGAEQITVFSVKGTLQSGRPLPAAEVIADRYGGMNWVMGSWGTSPVIYAGQGTKDHLRAAIQMLSGDVPKRVVFGHLGWRKLNGEWFYLHEAGGIGPKGTNHAIEVQISGSRLGCYSLPEPPTGEKMTAAIHASLSLLKVAPEPIVFPLLAAVYRAPLGEVAPLDVTDFFAGPTGGQKTELTALAQAHYGADFHAKNLPGNWSTTANTLEKQAFLVKDAVFTVDDFAPAGTTSDVQRLHREADRLIRSQGNRAGRGRMRPDGTIRPQYFPRGVILSSGEDIPRGQSLRSRMWITEVSKGDVDLDRLTEAQDAAETGQLAAMMAAYVMWLAPQIETLKVQVPQRLKELRADVRRRPVFHDRTPDAVASLAVGWEVFLRFACEAKAITSDERAALWRQCWKALLEAAEAQAGYQADEEPVSRFLALLGSAIASGQAHVAAAETNDAPQDADIWGWRKRTYMAGQLEQVDWVAQGPLVGWLAGDDLYLDPNSSFAAGQRLARDQGSGLVISAQTLWKRMAEEGKLVSRDQNRRRNTVRKIIGSRRRAVIHILAETLSPKSGPTVPSGPHPNVTAAHGAEKMGRFSGDGEKVAHKTGPELQGTGGPGPVGPVGPQIEHKGQLSDETLTDAASEAQNVDTADDPVPAISPSSPSDANEGEEA